MKQHRTSTEIGNRTAKAVRIVALLDRHLGENVQADTVAALPEESWSHVASLTGGRRISEATRETVLGIIAARDARSIVPVMDVFAGLGAA